MNHRIVRGSGLLTALCLLAVGTSLQAQTADVPEASAAQHTHEGPSMTTQHQIKGSFDVSMAPQGPDEGHETTGIGRLLIDKTFHGDLEAKSLGQMLAFRSSVEGSAGYVAMEKVTGSLGGRRGSFVLQHNGTMTAGDQHLDLNVVPDSGSEELEGLCGSMTIVIEDGKHLYEMEYSLPTEQ